MLRFCYDTRGAVAVFLSLIMLSTFVLGGIAVDFSRINAAKTTVSGAGDLAMNAALSEYDRVLKDVYGVFAMSKTPEDLNENLKIYFENTITGNDALQLESDDYTRQFFNNLADYITDPANDGFGNMLEMQLAEFKAEGVANSSIANPAVLERQIIEYMKYRGPVNMGANLLAKFNLIGEVPKQATVVDKKIAYEKELDEVGKICMETKELIDEYETAIAGLDHITANDDVKIAYENAKKDYQTMTEYLLAYNSLRIDQFSVDTSTYNSDYSSLSLRDLASLVQSNNNSTSTFEKYYTKTKDLNGNIQKQAETLDYLIDERETLDRAYTVAKNMIRAYDNFSPKQIDNPAYDPDDPDNTEPEKIDNPDWIKYESQREIAEDQIEKLDQLIKDWKEKRTSWKDTANLHAAAAQTALQPYLQWATDGASTAGAVVAKIERLQNKIKDLDKAGTDWQESMKGLSEGDFKSSMDADYQSKAYKISPENVEALKVIMEANKAYLASLKSAVESITYYGDRVCLASPSLTPANRFEGKIGVEVLSTGFSLETLAKSRIDENFFKLDIEAQAPRAESPACYIKLIKKSDPEYDPSQKEKFARFRFYHYLRDIYNAQESTKDSGKKADAENQKNALTNQANNSTTGESVTPGAVDTAILQAIQNYANNGGGAESSPDRPEMKNDDGESAQAAMKEVSGLLSGIEKILEDCRDNLYVQEYITEMFSYATIEWKDGKQDPNHDTNKNLFTIGNRKISAANNKLYGAEVEYVLWGDSDVQANVTKSEAMIYVLRLVLNIGYAFTDSEIQQWAFQAATAIAGWTGFGVPIVQTVITIAMAAGESALDLMKLMEGHSMPVYKSLNTWILKPSNIGKEALDLVKEKTESTINKFFETLSGYTEEKLGDATTQLERFVSNTLEQMQKTTVGFLTNPLQNLAMRLAQTEELTNEMAKEAIKEMLVSMRESVEDENDSMSKEAKLYLLDVFEDNFQQAFINMVLDCNKAFYSDVQEEVKGVQGKIEEYIKNLFGRLESEASDKLKGAGDALKDEIKDLLNDYNDKTQEIVSDKINEWVGSMGGTKPGDMDDGAQVTSGGGGFTLNYHEYLKLFVMLGTLNNGVRDNMLVRTAYLMQENVNMQKVADARQGKIDMTKAFTMVQVTARVDVKTSFLDLPVTSGSGGSAVELDYSQIGTGSQRLSYSGVYGY